MNRRGMSLIEMLGVIVLLSVFLPILGVVTARCLRVGRDLQHRPMRVDLLESACLHLRADAASGWTWTEGRLVTAGATWTMEDGWLRRGGANRYAGLAWTAVEADGDLRLVMTAKGLPNRTVLLKGGAP